MADFSSQRNHDVTVLAEWLDMKTAQNELRRSIDQFSSTAYETVGEEADAACVLLTLAALQPLCKSYPIRDRLDAVDQILAQLPFREPVRATALLAGIEILSGRECLEMSADEKMIRYGYIASDLYHTQTMFKDYSDASAEHVKYLASLADAKEDRTGHCNHKVHAIVKLQRMERDEFTEITDTLTPVIDKANLTIDMLYEMSRMGGRGLQTERPNA